MRTDGVNPMQAGAGTDQDLRDAVRVEIFDGVAQLTLARPPVNAFNDALLIALDQSLAQLEQRDDLVALHIRSAQRVFSAGADLNMVRQRLDTAGGPEAMMATASRFHRVYNRLAALPLVTVAEIGGHALGGGFELALACDLRLASTAALLGLPEAKVGLLPGAGGTQRLTQLCGPGVAARIILTGETVDGAEAQRLGMVQWSAAPDDLQALAGGVLARVRSLSPAALRASKACIRQAAVLPAQGAASEVAGIGALMAQPQTLERVSAFLGAGGRE